MAKLKQQIHALQGLGTKGSGSMAHETFKKIWSKLNSTQRPARISNASSCTKKTAMVNSLAKQVSSHLEKSMDMKVETSSTPIINYPS